MGFFDDLGRKATETYKTTADKTNKFAREVRLKSDMNECKNRIESIYAQIGKKVYEKHVLGNRIDFETDFKDEIEKIDSFSKKMESMNDELRVLKNLKLCNNCSAEISLDARFCPKCGTKVVEDDAKKQEAEVKENVESINVADDNESIEVKNEINETAETFQD